MNPKIDVTITDSHGDYAMLVSDNFEPYEVYVNNERFCTSERFEELKAENAKLRKTARDAWFLFVKFGAVHSYNLSEVDRVRESLQELGIEVSE